MLKFEPEPVEGLCVDCQQRRAVIEVDEPLCYHCAKKYARACNDLHDTLGARCIVQALEWVSTSQQQIDEMHEYVYGKGFIIGKWGNAASSNRYLEQHGRHISL